MSKIKRVDEKGQGKTRTLLFCYWKGMNKTLQLYTTIRMNLANKIERKR